MADTTRRQTILGAMAAGWVMTAAGPVLAGGREPRMLAYVGCRTNRAQGARGEGIAVFEVPRDGSPWQRVQTVGDMVNPSFLAFDRSRRFLYAVHGDETEVSAFAIDAGTGQISLLNRVTSGGRNPVHLTPDPTNRFMIIANHITDGALRSNIASLPIGADGRLGEAADILVLGGEPGPHRLEQLFPRPHQVQFDMSEQFILVPDKGCDRVRILTVAADGKLAEVGNGEARQTSGPRHIAMHPSNRYAYAINELDSTVTAYRFDAGAKTLEPFQILSSLADSDMGLHRAAEILVSRDGRFVYASNRGGRSPFTEGEDSIAAFAVDRATGRLASIGWTPTGGRIVRFFTMAPDGSALLVGNEASHTIVRLPIGRDGMPAAGTVVAHTGSPTCILFSA